TLATRPILIAQISDLHITRPSALAYGRVDTAAALLRAISTLNNLSPRPDLVVIPERRFCAPEEYAHATKLFVLCRCHSWQFLATTIDLHIPQAFPDPAYGTRHIADRFNCCRRTARQARCTDA